MKGVAQANLTWSTAFSLIELLVVIAVIAVLSGMLATTLTQRGSSHELEVAQNLVTATMTAARAQARLHQGSAYWIVSSAPADAESGVRTEKFLQVIRENPERRGAWITVGDKVFLPASVQVVPPQLSNDQLLEGVVWPVGPDAPLSMLAGPLTLQVGEETWGEVYGIEFSPHGRPVGGTARIFIGTVRAISGAAPKFDNASTVRGLVISGSGMIARLEDQSSD